MLNRFFRISESNSTVRTEIAGGATTFVTMAYIIVVNPAILSAAGFPVGPTTVATILVAVVGSLLMGLYANRPIAVAPYMGENAFIAFGLSAMTIGPDHLPITWQMRLGTVFVSGIIFLIITLLGIRGWLARAVSPAMKHSFAAGIGLFLAFIGLNTTKIIAMGIPAAPVKIGDFHDPKVLLAISCFVVMAALLCRGFRSAIILCIVLTAAAGYLLGLAEAPKGIVEIPLGTDYDLRAIAFQLDVRSVLQISFLPILITLVLMSFLDTLGTLVAVGSAANLLDKDGNFPQIERPMLVDAISCIFASLVGTSTSGAYIESAAGIRDGARTGLAAVVTALLFAAALFFLPLIQPLQSLTYAYGPALIAVGVLMLGSLAKIPFDDLTEVVPAFVTIVMMIFTYNIANGLTAGLIVYPVLKLLTGRWRDLNTGSIVLALACLVYYVYGLPH
ncbi:MAG TPA: NCS2 family permease [Gemmataceae bacterium]|jgi:AGZA family xanthine/uracil permease-like MFS transporter|nr:NCS2 family permease [Gemmataceae bacterium]